MMKITISSIMDRCRYFVLALMTLFSVSIFGQGYSETTLEQCISTSSSTLNFSLPSPQVPANDGQLTVYFKGDLDGGVPGGEIMEIYDPNNVLVGITPPSTGQCLATYDSVTFTIPITTLIGWVTGPTIDIDVLALPNVSTTLCATGSCAFIKLEYPSVTGDNDAAALSVDSLNSFCPGMQDIYATVANVGTNQLDSVMVNWEFNGVARTSINYTSLLDTINGVNPSSVSLLLGSEMFNSGSPNTIKVWTSMPNGVADTSNINDTINVTRSASLASGVYTLNANLSPSATNFTTFTDFTNTIASFGICGSVTLDVVAGSGPYLEQLKFNGFNGSSSRSITINGNNEVISFASSNTADRAVVSFENSSFISIDSMLIDATGGTFGYGVHLLNSSDISITNSVINADVSSTSANFQGVVASGSMTSVFTATQFDNFTFTGNTVVGGSYGIVTTGNTTSRSANIIIEDNIFIDWYSYGARHSNTDGLSFQRNDISRPGRTAATTTYGIYSLGNESMVMNRNAVHNLFDGITTSTSTCYPIYNSNDVPVGKEAVIMNNLVYNINHNGTIWGIYDLGSDNNLYYNNIISLDNTSASATGTTRGYYQSSASSGSEFQNNIISITRGGTGAKHGIYLNGSPGVSNHNSVFIGSTTGTNFYGFSGGNQATLADFQTAGFGANDVEGDPLFTDITLDDYQPLNLSLNAAGFPAPQVVEDFNGDARVVSANDIGAFRIASPPLDLAANSIDVATGFCPGNEDVFITVSNNGTVQVNSLTINWSINGVGQTPINYTNLIDTIGSVAGNSAQVLLTNYAFTANTLVTFEAIVSGANGTTVPDAFPSNDTTSLSTGASITGTFTLDANVAPSATNFVSFVDLSSALNTYGVCGPVNVTVAPGAYIESFVLNNIIGTSSTNTITIDGGDSSTTLLSYDGTTDFGTITINGADYVTIKNMSIDYTGATGAGIITANANHISVENSVITVDTNSTSFNLYAISLSSSVTANATGAISDYFNLSNSIIKGGYYGIRAYGSVGNSVKGISIVDNDFQQTWYYGVYLYYTDSVQIIRNNIDLQTRANIQGDGVYAFYTNNFNFEENSIRALDYGAYFFNSGQPFPNTQRNSIVNNMIYADTDYGMYLYYIDSVDIFHNTIISNSSSIPAVQLYNAGANQVTGYDMRNNIFYSNSSFALRTNIADSVMFSTMDYNNYYTSGANLLSINLTSYANLGGYTAANPSFNANSLEGDPQFLNYPLDFHVLGGLVNDMGDNSVGVTVDIDGDARPASGSTVVDMGADEYTPPSCTPPTAVTFTNITISGADINFVGNTGSTWEYELGPIGFTQGNGVLDTAVAVTDILSGLSSGTNYDVYVRELCSPTSASPIVGPYSFGTAFSIPLNESFETFTVGNTGTSFANGWNNSGTTTPQWQVEDASGANENSLLTGPFFDATFPNTVGGKYMYLETSGGALGDQNILSSPPVFVPTSATGLTLEFDYHMFGATMGNLFVVVDTNNVSDTVATFIGQQQTAGSDPFLTSTTPLFGYEGKSLTIRFIGVRGASYDGDISIDEVSLFEPSPLDLGVTGITSLASGCGLSATEPVTIDIVNFGLDSATTYTASFSVNGGTAVTETISTTILPGNSLTYTFTATANLSTTGVNTVEAFVTLAGDPNQLNDTTSISVTNIVVQTSPYTEDFDVLPDGEDDFTAISWSSINAGAYDWNAESTTTSSTATGPSGTRSGVGVYMYTEASSGTVGDTIYLESTCIDITPTGGTNSSTRVDYWYHMYGADVVALGLDIDSAGTWTTVDVIVGQQQTANADTFRLRSLDLSAYQSIGSTRFRFWSIKGASFNGDVAIDDFRIYDTVGVNVAMDSIVSPVSNCGLGANANVTVSISNIGLSAVSNFPVTYVLNNGTPVTDTVRSSINPGASLSYTFTNTVNLQAVGNYDLVVYTSVSGDGDVTNDTASSSIVSGFTQLLDNNNPFYANAFEQTTNNWVSYGTNNSWEIGTPSTFYINAPFNGSNAYVTSAASTHNANEMSYIETPCFDLSFFNPTDEFDLDFRILYQSEIGEDQLWMEVTTDNGVTWNKVLPDLAAVNFYNNTTDNVWEGFSSAGVGNYLPVLNTVTGIGGLSQVKFRFAFESNGTLQNDGFAIDEFIIGTPLYTGVEANTITASNFSISPNPTKDFVTIGFDNVSEGQYNLSVVDVKGQVVSNELFNVTSASTRKVIDLSEVEKGVYFVRIVSGETSVTQKLIVR